MTFHSVEVGRTPYSALREREGGKDRKLRRICDSRDSSSSSVNTTSDKERANERANDNDVNVNPFPVAMPARERASSGFCLVGSFGQGGV